MNALTYLNGLRPALPRNPSNSELRRWLANGTILFNTERCTWDEEIDFPVFSLVFFPSSPNRSTLI